MWSSARTARSCPCSTSRPEKVAQYEKRNTSRYLRKEASTMCEHCRNIQTWRKFDAPKDYLACIAYIQQFIAGGGTKYHGGQTLLRPFFHMADEPGGIFLSHHSLSPPISISAQIPRYSPQSGGHPAERKPHAGILCCVDGHPAYQWGRRASSSCGSLQTKSRPR